MNAIQSVPSWLPLTEHWLAVQVRNLPPEVKCRVVCRTINRRPGLPPVPVTRLPAGGGWAARARGTLLRRRVASADVIHSHFAHTGWDDQERMGEALPPQVVSCYGQDVTRLPQVEPEWRARYRNTFQRAALVLCEGPVLGKRAVALGCDPSRLRIHPLGVEVGSLPFQPRVKADGPLRVLVAASFREKKGIPDAIRAVAQAGGGVALTIVGDASEEPRSQREKGRIRAALRETGLEGRARLLGYQDHGRLVEEALAHHVLLSPSRTASDGDTEGGAPVTLIELAATGMPIVSTRHADIPQVVLDGQTGLLSDEGDVRGLAESLARLAAEPGMLAEMGRRARRHVEAHFDATRQGRRLASLYREAMEAGHGE